MIFIDTNTPREALEMIAIDDCGFSSEAVEASLDGELLEMIQDWIEAGDECAEAA